MKILNNILYKTPDFVCGVAEFVSTAIKLAIIRTFYFAVLISFLLLAFAVVISVFLLWMSVPYFICENLFSDINSLWQVYATLGIIGGWFILGKFVIDRLPSRWNTGRNKSPLDKFFEELDKRAFPNGK